MFAKVSKKPADWSSASQRLRQNLPNCISLMKLFG